MFNPFRHSPRNRRRDAGFTLFAETGEGAAPRRRRAWWVSPSIFVLLLATLVVGGGLVAQLAKERWLHRVEALALKRVLVARDGVLTEAEIRRLAGVQPGRNVLTIDLYALRQRLLRHPRIEDATVQLDFPDALRLDVRERVPVARVLLPTVGGVQAFYLLDDTGHVLLPFERGRAPEDIIAAEAALPLLTGLKTAAFSAGQALADEQALAALRLVAGFDSSAVAGVTELVSVDTAVPGVLTVLSTQGAQVTLTPDDLDQQLRGWRAVHDRAAALGRAIGTLDLSVRGNPPLKWLEAAAASVADPSPKPVRPKRKPARRHV